MKTTILLIITTAFLGLSALKAQFTIDRNQTFGGSDSEHFLDAKPTDDGGLMILGYSSSTDQMVSCTNTDNSTYTWLLKLDNQWNIEWQQCYGDGGDLNDLLQWIEPDGNGGWVMFGYVTASKNYLPCYKGVQDLWLVHVDSLGNVLEQRCFGGSKFDWPNDFQKTKDGSYLVAGASLSKDGDLDSTGYISTFREDAWMFKLDSAFNIVWTTTWGGTSFDETHAITVHPSGGYLALATSSSADGDVGSNYGSDDSWLLRLNDSGHVLWKQHYGGTMPDIINNLEIQGDSVIYMAGFSHSPFCQFGSRDFWLIKSDTLGNVIWEKCFGGTQIEEMTSMKIYQETLYLGGFSTSEDGYLFKNYGQEDLWLIAINDGGELLYSSVFGGTGGDHINNLLLQEDKILSVGYTSSKDHDIVDYHGGFSDAWLLSISLESVGLESVGLESRADFNNIELSYIPESESIIIHNSTSQRLNLLIYNALGVLVYTDTSISNKTRNDISIATLNQGFYIATLLGKNNNIIATKKIFKP